MGKRKITFVIQDLCGQGVQASTAAMIRGFAAKGYDVDLLISPVHQDRIASGMYAFPVPDVVHTIVMPSRHAKGNILFLRRYLKTTDSQAVFSTSIPYYICHAIAKIGIRRKVLHIAVDHDNWYSTNHRLKRQLIYGGFDRHFFVNETSRQTFLKTVPSYPAENTQVVWNPAVDDLFHSKAACPPSHPWLCEKRGFVFVSAGVFCDYKNQMLQLQAMNLLKGKADVRLILFGTGPLEASFKDYVAANGLEDMVSMPGYARNLPAEMRAADGYLMSSSTESFGIVIAEALAAGLPVISTDALYGPRDIISRPEYGTLVPVKDPKAMADAMLKLVKGPRRKVPDEAWQRFTVSSVVGYFEKGMRL